MCEVRCTYYALELTKEQLDYIVALLEQEVDKAEAAKNTNVQNIIWSMLDRLWKYYY